MNYGSEPKPETKLSRQGLRRRMYLSGMAAACLWGAFCVLITAEHITWTWLRLFLAAPIMLAAWFAALLCVGSFLLLCDNVR